MRQPLRFYRNLLKSYGVSCILLLVETNLNGAIFTRQDSIDFRPASYVLSIPIENEKNFDK